MSDQWCRAMVPLTISFGRPEGGVSPGGDMGALAVP